MIWANGSLTWLRFGCCLDGATAASGTELDGCPECEASDVCDCNVTKFGCCPDGRQPAFGPDKQGCDLERKWMFLLFGWLLEKIAFGLGIL